MPQPHPNRMPAFFISHGGGPWPWMADWRLEFAPLEASLAKLPAQLPARPKAVLMISGHWESSSFSVMSAARPPMVYDYHGFPQDTYEITYPAPGAPKLAARCAELIAQAELPTRLDPDMGFDHGTFVPMAVMYPKADIPLLQISLRHGYDPAEHLRMGRALAPLREEGVVIIGSGLSYHNLALFGPAAQDPSEQFDSWLHRALALPKEARSSAVLNWEQAPAARICHAKEDHLAPIFAALGAAENEPATRIYHQKNIFGGVTASGYRFG